MADIQDGTVKVSYATGGGVGEDKKEYFVFFDSPLTRALANILGISESGTTKIKSGSDTIYVKRVDSPSRLVISRTESAFEKPSKDEPETEEKPAQESQTSFSFLKSLLS